MSILKLKSFFIKIMKRDVKNEIISSNAIIPKKDTINNIMTYFHSINDVGYDNQIRLLIEEFKNEDNDIFNPLISILEQAFEKYDEMYSKYDKDYFELNKDEVSFNIVFNAINSNKQGQKDIEISLYDKEISEIEDKHIYKTIKMKAYFMDSIDLEIIKLYAQDIDNFEGYEFSFEEDISKLKKPCCYNDYMSDYFTLRGNEIDSNCDVDGTLSGAKAESLYMIYLTDLDKLIGIPVKYYCM